MQQSIKFADVSTSTHPVSKKVTYYVTKKEVRNGRVVTVEFSKPFSSEEAVKNEAKRYLLGIEVEASEKPTVEKFFYISQCGGSYSITTSLFEHKVGASIQHNGTWKTIIHACTDRAQAVTIWNGIIAQINKEARENAREIRAIYAAAAARERAENPVDLQVAEFIAKYSALLSC